MFCKNIGLIVLVLLVFCKIFAPSFLVYKLYQQLSIFILNAHYIDESQKFLGVVFAALQVHCSSFFCITQ